MFGLVDCNNFYASCERVFRPWLNGVPIVVLSNNDGCVIARSNEAKAMGIRMGVPFFQVKHLMYEGKIKVFSSNYALYGDMSRRVMNVIRSRVPRIEVYSIDECFVDFAGIANPYSLGLDVVRQVKQWTGIPVSMGIAPTKTLAKMASKFAKKYKGYKGCCIIDTDQKRLKALSLFPIGDVWGVGRRIGQRLLAAGVNTALDFTKWTEQAVKKNLGINGLRTWQELRGLPSVHIEHSEAKQTITTSRSFKDSIGDFHTMQAMVADFASHCSRKLRAQHSECRVITVFLHTNSFREDEPQRYGVRHAVMSVPTSDVREIVHAADEALKAAWLEGYTYKQAGVTVSGISNGGIQTDMYDHVDRLKQQRLLRAVDAVKSRFGDRMLRVPIQGDCSNEINRHFRSRNYTTNLQDILVVKT